MADTGRWITAAYATTLATNLSATGEQGFPFSPNSIDHRMKVGLLAFRIWNVNRQTARYRSKNRLSPILRVVVESGAIYSVTITAALIMFVIGSPGVYILLDMV